MKILKKVAHWCGVAIVGPPFMLYIIAWNNPGWDWPREMMGLIITLYAQLLGVFV